MQKYKVFSTGPYGPRDAILSALTEKEVRQIIQNIHPFDKITHVEVLSEQRTSS